MLEKCIFGRENRLRSSRERASERVLSDTLSEARLSGTLRAIFSAPYGAVLLGELPEDVDAACRGLAPVLEIDSRTELNFNWQVYHLK